MFITKLESCITMKKSDIQIDAKLQNISVLDPSSDTTYKYVSGEYINKMLINVDYLLKTYILTYQYSYFLNIKL